MTLAYTHRAVGLAGGGHADVFTARFPAQSLRFASVAPPGRHVQMRDAAHLRHFQARAAGVPDPAIVAWAALEQDMPARALFPTLEPVTEEGEHILSANSWAHYVLRVLLGRGWLRWRKGAWALATEEAPATWQRTARVVFSWLLEDQRLWLETGPAHDPPQALSFQGIEPAYPLVPLGRCGFARDMALATRARAVFNTAFFLLEPDDLVSHHSLLGEAVGLAVEDGVIVRPALLGRAAMWHTPARGWQTGAVGPEAMTLTLPDGTTFQPMGARHQPENPMRVNATPKGREAVLYTRAWGLAQTGRVLGRTPQGTGRFELTVVGRRVVGWKQGGGLSIPQNGLVLSLEDRALTSGQRQALQRYGHVTFGFASEALQGADHAVQCGPQLVRGGRVALHARSLAEEDFWVSRTLEGRHVVGVSPTDFPDDIDRTRAGRVGLGVDGGGDLVLVVVPGPSKGSDLAAAPSAGATLQELAAYLVEAGAVEAVNLDGGGSTQLFVDGGVLARQGDRRGYGRVVFDRMIPAVGVVEARGPWQEAVAEI